MNLFRLASGALVAATLLAVAGCASLSKSTSGSSAATETPGVGEYGPMPGPVPTDYVPQPAKKRPLLLVLGPGMARGFAYVGVIRALTEAKIPVGAIFGTEMGGFIGALYGMSANSNYFEWAWMRFKPELFSGNKKSLLSRVWPGSKKSGDTQALEQETRRVFAGKDLKDAKIPVWVAFQPAEAQAALVTDKGNAAQVVLDALNQPATPTRPFLVKEAQGYGIGPVVVVDVFQGSEDQVVQELAGSDLVIVPDMTGIGFEDFDKRNESAFRGKRAAQEQLDRIRELTGTLSEGSGQ